MTTKTTTTTNTEPKRHYAPGIEVSIPSEDGSKKLIAVRAGEKGQLVSLSVQNGKGGPRDVGTFDKVLVKDLLKTL